LRERVRPRVLRTSESFSACAPNRPACAVSPFVWGLRTGRGRGEGTFEPLTRKGPLRAKCSRRKRLLRSPMCAALLSTLLRAPVQPTQGRRAPCCECCGVCRGPVPRPEQDGAVLVVESTDVLASFAVLARNASCDTDAWPAAPREASKARETHAAEPEATFHTCGPRGVSEGGLDPNVIAASWTPVFSTEEACAGGLLPPPPGVRTHDRERSHTPQGLWFATSSSGAALWTLGVGFTGAHLFAPPHPPPPKSTRRFLRPPKPNVPAGATLVPHASGHISHCLAVCGPVLCHFDAGHAGRLIHAVSRS
jgi:hypothetical protein